MADTPQQNPDEKVRVKVVVAPRANYPGVWAAGRLFPSEETETVLTRRELEAVKAKKAGIAIVELGPAGQPPQAPSASGTTPHGGARYDTKTATSPLEDSAALHGQPPKEARRK
jgi:hypothetical protein